MAIKLTQKEKTKQFKSKSTFSSLIVVGSKIRVIRLYVCSILIWLAHVEFGGCVVITFRLILFCLIVVVQLLKLIKIQSSQWTKIDFWETDSILRVGMMRKFYDKIIGIEFSSFVAVWCRAVSGPQTAWRYSWWKPNPWFRHFPLPCTGPMLAERIIMIRIWIDLIHRISLTNFEINIVEIVKVGGVVDRLHLHRNSCRSFTETENG